MFTHELSNTGFIRFFAIVLLVAFSFCYGCSESRDKWQSLNNKIIKDNNIVGRSRNDIPKTGIGSNLEPGNIVNKVNLSEIRIAEDVTGKIYWENKMLVNWMVMKPGSVIPEETLSTDRIMVVWKGSLEQLINGRYVQMKQVSRIPVHHDRENGWQPVREFVYLKKGSLNGVKAGLEGCEFVEIYSPARTDYIAKTGQSIPANVPAGEYTVSLPFQPNKVYDYYDVQFSELNKGIYSKIIPCLGAQASFMYMNPGSEFKLHNHPESLLRIVLRGSMEETIMDKTLTMSEGEVVFLPGNMVHGEKASPQGCDVLDVFSPGRPDYETCMLKRLAAYHSIVPEGETPKLIYDGATREISLRFAEGPSWMNGRLYFSSMWYDNFSVWPGNPAKSKLVSIKPDGSDPQLLQQGMQTNGTMPLGNGNLVVNDMHGHRILEMTPKGKIVRTIVSEAEGKRLDGPNDLAILPNGGMYFTDPQIVPEPHMQSGPSVFYRKPDGKVIRVIEPGEFAVPNGLILRYDSKVLYVNNTYDDATHVSDKDNFIWVYDVNEDGTLSNERKFCELFVTPDQLTLGNRSTSSDGMAVDTLGNLYDCTFYGIQIFNINGEFVGMINTPLIPINAKFGGDDMQTLFAVCYDKVYAIHTNVKGVRYPLQ